MKRMKVSWEIKKRIKILEAERDKLDPLFAVLGILDYNHRIRELKWVLDDD